MLEMEEIISTLEDMDQQMKNQQEENKKLLTEILNIYIFCIKYFNLYIIRNSISC